jgi:chemotaxis signal transduction protein
MSPHATDGFVVFHLGEELYGLRCGLVEGLVRPEQVVPVPQSPDWILGVADLRGRQLPLVDLRTRLGYTSAAEETRLFHELMEAREQDHRNWLATLEKCVAEGHEFTLATDPHQCKFGVWYDKARTGRLSPRIRRILDRFDAPHRAIHAIATSVMEFVRKGDTAGAVAAMDRTRSGELASMIDLFAEVRREYAGERKGMTIITQCGAGAAGLVADRVVAVTDLSPVDTAAHELGAVDGDARLLDGLWRDSRGNLVLAIDAAAAAGTPEITAGDRLALGPSERCAVPA